MTTTLIDLRNGIAEGLAVKAPCRVATTAQMLLRDLPVVDGVQLADGDRVLAWFQTDPKQNGIYNAGAGPWERVKDFDGARDAVQGTRVFVTDGSLYEGIEFVVTTENPLVPGSSNIAFEPLGDAAVLSGAVRADIAQSFSSGQKAQARGNIGLGNVPDVDATNASNLSSGTMPPARISGSYGGITGVGTLTGGLWQATRIGLAYGGSNADLSATGGAGHVLRQSSAGAGVTVSQLAASDLSNGVTGSGSVVLATSPALVTPALGAATATTINGVTITGAGTLNIPTGASLIRSGGHSLTLTTAATTNLTIPSGTRTAVTLDSTQTLTNKTLTSPVINSPTGIVKADVGLANVPNTDATNAGNIGSGTLPSARLVGAYNQMTGVGTLTAGTWQATKIGLAYGGTNADLGATGGAGHVLRQSTVGGNVSVSQLAASDLSNGVTGTGAVVLASALGSSGVSGPGSSIDNSIPLWDGTTGALLKDSGLILGTGTFTPTFSFSTPGNLAVTYSSQNGLYLLIGDWVIAVIDLVCTPTHSTASGGTRIGGLPFSVGSVESYASLTHAAGTSYPGTCSRSPDSFPRGDHYR